MHHLHRIHPLEPPKKKTKKLSSCLSKKHAPLVFFLPASPHELCTSCYFTCETLKRRNTVPTLLPPLPSTNAYINHSPGSINQSHFQLASGGPVTIVVSENPQSFIALFCCFCFFFGEFFTPWILGVWLASQNSFHAAAKRHSLSSFRKKKPFGKLLKLNRGVCHVS